MAHVVIKLLAVFTAVCIGKNISTARIAFDSTHEWHGEEQKNRASVKDHHRPFWLSPTASWLASNQASRTVLGSSAAWVQSPSAARADAPQEVAEKSTCERKHDRRDYRVRNHTYTHSHSHSNVNINTKAVQTYSTARTINSMLVCARPDTIVLHGGPIWPGPLKSVILNGARAIRLMSVAIEVGP